MNDEERASVEHYAWLRGYASALASIIRERYDEFTVTAVLLNDHVTLLEMIHAGADKADAQAILDAIRGCTDRYQTARGETVEVLEQIIASIDAK